MKIIPRYMIRAHVGPFLFAFTALTGLIFLNAVAQRLDTLAGRGLGFAVIGEFFLLSLPHVIALTLPMSILVATLYAFSDLTGSNEVAATSAGGIHPGRLIVPLVGVGLVIAGTVFFFNNRVLPEANHRLSSLLTDISSKSPTFQLREEVVNEIHTGDDSRYFLRAATIDSETQELADVTIFDLSGTGVARTIRAEHGRMQVTPDGRDLYMTLRDGTMLEAGGEPPGSFQRLRFETHVLPMRGVFQELERQASDGQSDREMTIAELRLEVENGRLEQRQVQEEGGEVSALAVDIALRGVTAIDLQEMGNSTNVGVSPGSGDDEAPGPTLIPSTLVRDVEGVQRINQSRWELYRLSSARYSVEIHKKYAIAVACLIFILLGPTLAMRFPQGGVGMVIAASVGIFFIYWVGLIGGEALADRGQLNPAVAMWTPNVLLLAWAGFLLSNVADRISTNRGSGWAELWVRLRSIMRGSSPASAHAARGS